MLLSEKQHMFMQGVFHGDLAAPILDVIQENKSLSSEQQLAIYRNSIFGGLSNALTETFPVIKKLVGEKFFSALLIHYINHYPPQSHDLNDYGKELADFITTLPAAEHLPYLADVARLEWHWNMIFYSADSVPSNLTEMDKLDEAQQSRIVWQLPTASVLLESDHPLHLIWQANQHDHIDKVINLEQGGEKLIIWRNGYDMKIDLLDQSQWLFLSMVNKGNNITNICERILTDFPGLEFGLLLREAVINGWLQNFYIQEIE